MIKEAIKIVCQDPGFSLPSPQASVSLNCAKIVEKWIDENYTSESYTSFSETIIHLVTQCLPSTAQISKKQCAELWGDLSDFCRTFRALGNIFNIS